MKTTHLHLSPPLRVAAVAAIALAVGLAPATPVTASPAGSTSSSRIVVGTDTAAIVLDAGTLSTIGTIPLAARPALAPSGSTRHVFLTPSGTGTVRILDTGAKVRGHRATAPHLEAGVLAGVRPGHVVAEHGRTAVFDDGTGVIQVVRDSSLSRTALSVRAFAPYPAHHGIALPLRHGYLVSVPAADSTARVGVARISDKGRVVSRWDTCPGLHGEGHARGGVIAFGCEDGIFVYRAGKATKIAEPLQEGRTTTLAGSESSTVLAGNFLSTSVLLADTRTSTTRMVDLGTEYGAIGRDDEDRVVVLGTDGAIHLIDPKTGAGLGQLPVLDAWTTADTIRPSMSVAGHEAFVTSPASRSVLRVDLEDGSIKAEVTLASAPTGVLAPGGGHSH